MLKKERDTCTKCLDTGWVCEDHRDKVWAGMMPRDFVECCGGAGAPCACNKANPPWNFVPRGTENKESKK